MCVRGILSQNDNLELAGPMEVEVEREKAVVIWCQTTVFRNWAVNREKPGALEVKVENVAGG